MFKHYIRHSGSLFLLNIPPPYGGGEIVNQFLFEKIKDLFDVVTVSREVHGKSSQGRLTLRNIVTGLSIVVYEGFWILRLRPRLVFIGIPKDFFAFVRTSILVYLSRMTGARVVGDLHGMGFKFLDGTHDRYYRYTINKFDRIRVLGEGIKNDIAATGFRHELRVIDNGVGVPHDLHRQFSYRAGERVRLLYLGAISESKGFGRSVEVFRELCRMYPGLIALDIAGEFVDTESRVVFQKLLSEKGIGTFVKFHGRVLHQEKWNLLTSCTLLLHFSRYDGQPITIVEAMALGLPAVATKVGAIPEMITHGVDGFLVDNYFTDSIKIVVGLMNGTIDYEPISNNAKTTYHSRFTVERYAENIRSLIENAY